MKATLPAMPAKGFMQPVDRDANLSHLCSDLAGGAIPEVVKSLPTTTAPDYLLCGSDYPCRPAKVLTENLRRVRSGMAEDERLAPYLEDMLSNNAIALFTGKTDRPNTPKIISKKNFAVSVGKTHYFVYICNVAV